MFTAKTRRWHPCGPQSALTVITSRQNDENALTLEVHYSDHALLRVKLQRAEDATFHPGLDGTFSNVLPDDYVPGITIPASWPEVQVTCMNMLGGDTVIAFHKEYISGEDLSGDYRLHKNQARYLVIQRPDVPESQPEVPHVQLQMPPEWADIMKSAGANI